MTLSKRLADAIQRAAERSVEQRAASWALASVTAVYTDGTVDISTATGPVERVRRHRGYDGPTVGDTVKVTRNPDGNWLVSDALGTSADAWHTPTLASPWVAYSGSGNYRGPRYRKSGGDAVIEGLAATGGTSVTGTSNVFTLPTGYRPSASYAFAAVTSAGATRQLSVLDSGVVQYANLPAGAVSFISLNCRFSIS